jgi:putative component of toxin-antitoxin plasmid stabilization module
VKVVSARHTEKVKSCSRRPLNTGAKSSIQARIASHITNNSCYSLPVEAKAFELLINFGNDFNVYLQQRAGTG